MYDIHFNLNTSENCKNAISANWEESHSPVKKYPLPLIVRLRVDNSEKILARTPFLLGQIDILRFDWHWLHRLYEQSNLRVPTKVVLQYTAGFNSHELTFNSLPVRWSRTGRRRHTPYINFRKLKSHPIDLKCQQASYPQISGGSLSCKCQPSCTYRSKLSCVAKVSVPDATPKVPFTKQKCWV